MGYLVLLLIIVIIVVIFMRKKAGDEERADASASSGMQQREPRDFLGAHAGYLQTPRPLREMLEENRPAVMKELGRLLFDGGTYERKYAAFALGQIGESAMIPHLEKAVARERTSGVKDAMVAALVALRQVPVEGGHSEMDRRRVIERTYWSS